MTSAYSITVHENWHGKSSLNTALSSVSVFDQSRSVTWHIYKIGRTLVTLVAITKPRLNIRRPQKSDKRVLSILSKSWRFCLISPYFHWSRFGQPIFGLFHMFTKPAGERSSKLFQMLYNTHAKKLRIPILCIRWSCAWTTNCLRNMYIIISTKIQLEGKEILQRTQRNPWSVFNISRFLLIQIGQSIFALELLCMFTRPASARSPQRLRMLYNTCARR